MAWDYSVRGSGPAHTARVETRLGAVGRAARLYGSLRLWVRRPGPQVETRLCVFSGRAYMRIRGPRGWASVLRLTECGLPQVTPSWELGADGPS